LKPLDKGSGANHLRRVEIGGLGMAALQTAKQGLRGTIPRGAVSTATARARGVGRVKRLRRHTGPFRLVGTELAELPKRPSRHPGSLPSPEPRASSDVGQLFKGQSTPAAFGTLHEDLTEFCRQKAQTFTPVRQQSSLFPGILEGNPLCYVLMTQEYRHKTPSVSLSNYHLIFCPKRRRKVLVNTVKVRLDTLIRETAAALECTVLALEIMPDHVHLFLSAPPTLAPHTIVRRIKGRSSRVLRQEFPHLLRLPSLWTRSYFSSTAGNVSSQTIQRYIAEQQTRG
jgi:putative transposase